jgi:5'-nucleotidase / UDP-sugar diphosphatase
MASLRRALIPAALAMVPLLACSGKEVPAVGGPPPGGGQPFIILHTNDIHSHLMGFGPEAEYTPDTTGDDGTLGGLARLAARIKAERAAAGNTPVLLLDAGDFMMGSPFQILARAGAAELVEMNKLAFDATTIGNHELDWGVTALTDILRTAVGKGVNFPVLATNMIFSDSDPSDDTLAGLVKRKVIKEVGSIKVGIFGLLGKDASDVSPLKKPLGFEAIVDSARKAVAELRQMDRVDVVIALSHSGIDEMGMGEDRVLADDAMIKAAGGIDVIVSGHTHDALGKPIKTGNTWIVQAGSYGRNLGKLQLTASKTASGTTLALTKPYELLPIDDMIAGDGPTQSTVEGYVSAIDVHLSQGGFLYKNVVGEVEGDVTDVPFAESGIGDLVADSYLIVARMFQPDEPPALAIDAAGDIRDEIKKGKTGKLWFSDLFRVQSLGIGPDMQPGYPLVSFYVSGKDLKAAFEFSATAKDLGKPNYFLHVAGATVEWKASAPALKRVTSIKVGDTAVDLADDTKCYKTVTNLYVASLLGLVETATAGVLSVKPKAQDCTTLVDPTTQLIDREPGTPGTQELKEWQALNFYVYALPDTDTDSIPNVPASYGAPAVPPRVVIKP